MAPTIYKVLTEAQWYEVERGAPVESPVDVKDGYVHFSTADTLQETLARWFSGERGCRLLAFDAERFGPLLRWEPARGGQLFPHVYGLVRGEQAERIWLLELGDDGVPRAPSEP